MTFGTTLVKHFLHSLHSNSNTSEGAHARLAIYYLTNCMQIPINILCKFQFSIQKCPPFQNDVNGRIDVLKWWIYQLTNTPAWNVWKHIKCLSFSIKQYNKL